MDVPLSHPIYHVVYDFPQGLPKIHEHDGKPAQGLGIFLGDRLAVFYDYQCDLGDGWEDPDVHKDPPELHEAALRMGYGAEIAATVQEDCFWHLDQPVRRIAAKNTPTPTSPPLEDAVIPQPAQIAQVLREVVTA